MGRAARLRPDYGNSISVRIGQVEVECRGTLTSCVRLLDRVEKLLDKPGILDAIGRGAIA
ncbi:MAG: hypothetical protein QOG31_1414 [Thermoplasmata archaeon]|jgi:hypothetical protein|nr:hypothetical protein [Thermoplasmata archaeon]